MARGPLINFALQHVRRVTNGLTGFGSGVGAGLGCSLRCVAACRRELRHSRTLGPDAIDRIFRDCID